MVVAVVVMAVAVAGEAMAMDFKFSGSYRMQFQSAVNAASAPNAFIERSDSNPRRARWRVRPQFNASDDNGNIQGVLRLEIGDIIFGQGGGAELGGWTNANTFGGVPGSSTRTGPSNGGGLGTDGVNVKTAWAYLDALFPFGIPLRARVGAQPFFLPKSILFDDNASGVRLYGSVKPVSYDLWWARLNDESNTRDDAYDVYTAKVDVAIAPFFNPGVYYVYGRNALETVGVLTGWGDTAESHYLGATVTGKAGIVAYDLDFIWGTAEGGSSGTFTEVTRGWMADAGVHFPIGPVTINIAAAYATGDERDGGKSEAFPGGYEPNWSGAGGGFDLIGAGGPFDLFDLQDAAINIWMVGGWVTYTPVKALTLKANYAFAGFVDKNGNCAGAAAGTCYGPAYTALAGEDTIGHELSVMATYTVWTGFTVTGQAGWLIPKEGDTAAEYNLQLQYAF
jgi:hypothetical protein